MHVTQITCFRRQVKLIVWNSPTAPFIHSLSCPLIVTIRFDCDYSVHFEPELHLHFILGYSVFCLVLINLTLNFFHHATWVEKKGSCKGSPFTQFQGIKQSPTIDRCKWLVAHIDCLHVNTSPCLARVCSYFKLNALDLDCCVTISLPAWAAAIKQGRNYKCWS